MGTLNSLYKLPLHYHDHSFIYPLFYIILILKPVYEFLNTFTKNYYYFSNQFNQLWVMSTQTICHFLFLESWHFFLHFHQKVLQLQTPSLLLFHRDVPQLHRLLLRVIPHPRNFLHKNISVLDIYWIYPIFTFPCHLHKFPCLF